MTETEVMRSQFDKGVGHVYQRRQVQSRSSGQYVWLMQSEKGTLRKWKELNSPMVQKILGLVCL